MLRCGGVVVQIDHLRLFKKSHWTCDFPDSELGLLGAG